PRVLQRSFRPNRPSAQARSRGCYAPYHYRGLGAALHGIPRSRRPCRPWFRVRRRGGRAILRFQGPALAPPETQPQPQRTAFPGTIPPHAPCVAEFRPAVPAQPDQWSWARAPYQLFHGGISFSLRPFTTMGEFYHTHRV